jgi:hypothetical protein
MSLHDQKPEEQATPAATGEAFVSVTQIESPSSFTTTAPLIGSVARASAPHRDLRFPGSGRVGLNSNPSTGLTAMAAISDVRICMEGNVRTASPISRTRPSSNVSPDWIASSGRTPSGRFPSTTTPCTIITTFVIGHLSCGQAYLFDSQVSA